MTPAKEAAHALMLRRFERIGERWHQYSDEQLMLMDERRELEELWKLAGFGEAPPFEPTMPRVARLLKAGAA